MPRQSATSLPAALIIAFTSLFAPGAEAAEQDAPRARVLRGEDLQADAALLRRAFEAVHPGLHRYHTPDSMDKAFAALEHALSRDQTVREAFLTLSAFTASIKCGHTYLNPTNQSKAIVNELFSAADKVPFTFRWLGARMLVTGDCTPDGALPRGTEILTINGVHAGEILSRLMRLVRSDGANDAKRVSLLEVTGNEQHEDFDVFFPMLFPSPTPGLTLTVKRPAETGEASVVVASIASRPRTQDTEPIDGDAPLWRLETTNEGFAYLRMRTWVAYKTKWDWVGFLNDVFDTLTANSAPNLIIDLRGNGGGSAVGDVIIARLIERPAPRSANHRFVRYLKTPPELDAVLDTWDPTFKDWTSDAVGPIDLADRQTGLAPGTTAGFHRLRNKDGADPAEIDDIILPRGPRYTGRLFVIVDASNSSATFEFAERVRTLRLGTLVGVQTGGNLRGINGGAFFFVRLPRTGFELDLPIMGQFPKQPGPLAEDAGIVPDVIVTPTIADIASGEDAPMREIRRIIAAIR